MKTRRMMLAALLAAMALPVVVPAYAAGVPDNPPGPAGGPGTSWRDCPGWDGGAPGRPHRRLSDEQRAKLKAMSPEQRRAYCLERCEKRMQQRFDQPGTPSGPRGGPGANSPSQPAPRGGPGAGADRVPPVSRP